MIETYHIGTYWGARKEDAEECARRLVMVVQLLQPVDPLFASWFKSARSLKQSLTRPLELEVSSVQQYIQRYLMRDDRRQPMEDLGFSFGLWNGKQGENHAWLSIACGGYWEQVTNRCVLDAPNEGPGVERVLTEPFQVAALRALVTAWDPDWGAAISTAYRDMSKTQYLGAKVGWVTYFSRRLGRVPPLPAPVRIEPVEDQGTLVILTPERFTATNPEHVALADRVCELLERAGLLQRKPPPAK
ncbi:immunity 52 family protein [Hyalangium gracile]|uniref:immunity 52 family protein n=1 Tax=Hyalangium gracile TaxID=394092 RepID=UPI001CC9F7DF|nr:immunity 52 family protein [Hyalangium gracile]